MLILHISRLENKENCFTRSNLLHIAAEGAFFSYLLGVTSEYFLLYSGFLVSKHQPLNVRVIGLKLLP